MSDCLEVLPAFEPLGPCLRTYTPALARLARALFRAMPDTAPASHAGQRFAAHALRDLSQAFIVLQRPLTLVFDTADGALIVQLDASRHLALEAIALESDAQQRHALATLWLAEALAVLADAGLTHVTLNELRYTSTAQRAQGLVLEYNLRAAENAPGSAAGSAPDNAPDNAADNLSRLRDVLVLLTVPDALAARLEHNLHGLPAPSAHFADLLLPTRLRVRSRHCNRARLAALREGDILLGWPRARGYCDGAPLHGVMLHWGAASGHSISARACVIRRTLLLETFPHTMRYPPDDTLHETTASHTPHATGIDLNALELPVHLEVICASLPLSQLSTLAPGYVLELPLALADAQVRLVSYGQTLAFGELVAVGDQLGLHIQRITHPDERHT